MVHGGGIRGYLLEPWMAQEVCSREKIGLEFTQFTSERWPHKAVLPFYG